jgi:hypothetical protein
MSDFGGTEQGQAFGEQNELNYSTNAGGVMVGAQVTERAAAMLSATRPWIKLIATVWMILIGLGAFGILVFAFVLSAASIASGEPLAIIGVVLLAAVQGIPILIQFFPANYLRKYGNSLSRFAAAGMEQDLEDALSAQKSFWKFVGILVIIYLVLFGIFVLLFLLGGVISFL